MSDEFEQTVRVSATKTFLPTSMVRRDIFSQIKGPGAPQTIVIQHDITIMGRSQDATVRFYSTRVSRKHVKLTHSGPDLICTDLDSHNGLFLNGIKVYSCALRDGDTVQIGDIVLMFHQGVQWASM